MGSCKTRGGLRRTAAVMSALLLACCTAACQPTPEEEIIVNKGDGALEAKIAQTAEPAAAYKAPDKQKDSFACKDDRVLVNIDATVNVPEVARFPVIDIAPEEITPDFVEKAVEALMEGKTVYEPGNAMTKAEIQEEILDLQQALADPENSTSDGLSSDDPETVAETALMFKQRIEIYKRLYETAPEEYMRVEAALEFRPAKYYENPVMYEEEVAELTADVNDEEALELLNQYDNEQKLVLDTNLDGGYYGRITASNYQSGNDMWNRFLFEKSRTLSGSGSPSYEFDTPVESDMTQDEVEATAEETLSQLGIEDMALTNVFSEQGYGYYLTFQRVYGGVPVIDDPEDQDVYGKQYGPTYSRERIIIRIMDDELVYLMWNNPSKQASVENKNVVLKDFSEITDTFERQISLEYTLEKLSGYGADNPDYDEYIASLISGRINVTEIELGMVRVSVQDNPGTYRMIPAWKFYGTVSIKMMCKGNEEEYSCPNSMVFLTVNAIDGSVIDPVMGY